MNAYIITLKPEKKLIKQVQNKGFNPILIKGINGKLIDKSKLKEIDPLFKIHGTPGAIGCALSHLKAWKTFLKSREENCIIFEDDIVFDDLYTTSRFNNVLKSVPKDFDILYMGYFNFGDKPCSLIKYTNENAGKINEDVSVPKTILGAHAYVLSRKGAEKLVSLLDGKIWFHIDVCLNHLAYKNKINVYSSTQRLIHQTSTDTLKSLNTGNNSPYIINHALSKLYLDKNVRANYVSSFSIMTINNGYLHFNLFSVLFLIFGIILTKSNIKITTITILFLLLSIPDFLFGNVKNIFIHGILLILPSVLLKKIM